MTDFLPRHDGARIAYRRQDGRGPGLVWLGGFRSDLTGTKAEVLAAFAARENRAFVRFDYFGHGASSGEFRDGTISHWKDDALAVLDSLTEGPQVLIGSSMGGWMATLLAKARPERIAGIVLIAPAPDFTEDLMWKLAPPEVQAAILERGVFEHQPEGGEGYPITRALIEDGRRNIVLDTPIALAAPVRILHGSNDTSVPWQHGLRLLDVYSGDVTFTLIKGSDHRLSTESDLRLIERTVENLLRDLA